MNIKTLSVALSGMFLMACTQMQPYYDSVDRANQRQMELQRAKADADVAKYQALAQIAQSGDSTAKIAATMAIALGTASTQQSVPMVAPQAPRNEALEWASLLVPAATQGLGIIYNTKAQMNASDNATKVNINTNDTFRQFASEINDPTVVMQPAPVVVTQPDPVIVNAPEPVIVQPTVVQPEVVIVQ